MRQDFSVKKVLSTGGILLLFIVVIGYGIWISHDLLFGISMSVTGITDGMTAKTALLDLSGRAKHANDVTLDGRTVAIDQNGVWHDTIALLPGYNIVTVGATDKFGRTMTKSYRVYYTAPPAVQYEHASHDVFISIT